MDNMKRTLILILMLSLLFSGRRDEACAMEQNKLSQAITVEVPGESHYYPNVVDMYFPSSPSTGFSWFARAEDENLLSIEEDFVIRISVDAGNNVLIWGIEMGEPGQ